MIKHPLLSVLVPSRERAEALKFSLDSLGLKRNKIEALVWVDDDDPQLKKYRAFFGSNKFVKLYIKPKIGYIKANEMYDFLTSNALGDWFFLWNDDAYMENVQWYDTFLNFASSCSPSREPVVYNIWGQGKPQNLFPIISRKYFEIVGHWSLNTICDTWVKHISQRAKILRYIFGIKPHHRKFGQDNHGLGDLIDNTLLSVHQLEAEAGDIYLGQKKPENLEKMENDTVKVIKWIKKSADREIRVGFIGLGELGLPLALATEIRGKNVVAYDINQDIRKNIIERKNPLQVSGADGLLPGTKMQIVDSVSNVVKKCNFIIYSEKEFKHLKKDIQDIVRVANKLKDKTTLVLVTACPPSTFEKDVKPYLSTKVNYLYSPYLHSMEMVIHNFLNPDIILIGHDNTRSNNTNIIPLINFYKIIVGKDVPIVTANITDVETKPNMLINDAKAQIGK